MGTYNNNYNADNNHNRSSSPRSQAQQRVRGILIPLWRVDGQRISYQYRPDHPRVNQEGRPIKYENPAGSSVRLDVPPRCREQLGGPHIPIFFTEGVKKVDALASQGVCAIGLTGVLCSRSC